MKSYKKIFFIGFALSLSLFMVLPLLNLKENHWKISFDEAEKLFSLDLMEGYINYGLYQLGVSGDYDNILIGKEGWMFVGQKYSPLLNEIRGLDFPAIATQNIKKTVSAIKQRQEWLTARGIKTLFAIVPNKHSIHKEYLPGWLPALDRNSTDRFVDQAKAAGIHVLDLRAPLLKYKSVEPHLYFKVDAHWNNLGSLIGYQGIVAEMNRQFGMQLKPVEIDSYKPFSRGAGDLTRMLKFKNLMDKNLEQDFKVNIKGMPGNICRRGIDLAGQSLKGPCVPSKSPVYYWDRSPNLAINKNAPNDLTLLWLGDSFSVAPSDLFEKTFSRVFEIHHRDLAGNNLQVFIEKYHPDIILYLIVERDILRLSSANTFEYKSDFIRNVTRHYMNGKQVPPGLLYTMAHDITPNKDVKMAFDKDISQLKLDVTGGDPILLLPKMDAEVGSSFLIKMEMESQRNTIMRFYYKTLADNRYSKEKSLSAPIKTGINKLYFAVPGEFLKKQLRFDPSVHTGHYILRNFSIHKLPPTTD